MPSVRKINLIGSETRYVGDTVHFKVERTHPFTADRTAVKWRVVEESTGDILKDEQSGAEFEYQIPESVKGTYIHVSAYYVGPTSRASCRLKVRRRLGANHLTQTNGRPAPIETNLLSEQGTAAIVTVHTQGDTFHAEINGSPRFYVGTRLSTRHRGVRVRGIKTDTRSTQRETPYSNERFLGTEGHWSHVVTPTALAESGGFLDVVNTQSYRGVAFGFLQQSIIGRNGSFPVLLRELLSSENAGFYFPDLVDSGGRFVRQSSSGVLPLDGEDGALHLQRYFKPSHQRVEPREIIAAAKLLYWVRHDRRAQLAQVRAGIFEFKSLIADRGLRHHLNGVSDYVISIIGDLHWRHRGGSIGNQILSALEAPHPIEALLAIDAASSELRTRNRIIRTAIEAAREERNLGVASYDSQINDFKPVEWAEE